jgi:hypothetical protein
MIKTSESHPIRIDAIDAGAGRGRIGVTFAPAASGYWERDLAKDLDAIANWKVNAIVTLIEPHEMDLLGVPRDEVGAVTWTGSICRSATSARRAPRSRRIADCETCSTTVRTFSSTAAAVSAAPA